MDAVSGFHGARFRFDLAAALAHSSTSWICRASAVELVASAGRARCYSKAKLSSGTPAKPT